MRKIVQKNEASIMKLNARRGLECRIYSRASGGPEGPPSRKGHQASLAARRNSTAVHINLPATFQFSPATSKSIDIPDLRYELEFKL